MNAGRGYSSGAGYLVRTPSFDIAEVGAGGGSIIWVERAGAPRIGPRSSGARPGPACYGLGGTEPTLSDACVAVGYFNPHVIAGGVQRIEYDLAVSAIQRVASTLGIALIEAAFGAAQVAVANMTALVRAVTTLRGRDPRDFALVASGESGPAYAAYLARSLGMSTVSATAGSVERRRNDRV